MTDSILRSYQAYTHTSIVPFAAPVVIPGALGLLDGETDGFAIDATDYDDTTEAVYVGGPVGGTVAVIDTGTPANDLSNVALDASNLVQSGTSAKMCHFDTSPYVRWSPHNMVIQSQTLGTSWNNTSSSISANATTAPDGTSTADKFVEGAAGDGFTSHFMYQTRTGLVGATYTVSVYAKAAERSWLNIDAADDSGHNYCFFDLTNGVTGTTDADCTSSITSVGSGWYRCSVTRVNTNATFYAWFYVCPSDNNNDSVGDGASGLYLWGAQINRGPIATPYLVTTTAARIGIPQSYDAAAAQYGILVEQSVTNYARYSEKFDTGSFWGVSGVTVSADTTTAPDGATTADTFVEDSANSRHGIVTLISGTVTGRGTVSCYVKQKDRQWAHLASFSTDDNHVYGVTVDLTDGSVTSTQSSSSPTNTSYSVTSVGNGWWRIAVTQDLINGCYYLLGLSNSATPSYSGSLPSYTGDGASGMYVWGAQLEAGAVATSYVPTVANATATRAVDTVSTLITTFPYSQTTGTIYYDGRQSVANTSHPHAWLLYETVFDRFLRSFRESGTAGKFQYIDAASANDIAYGAYTETSRHQITAAWAAADFDAAVNGVLKTPTATGDIPNGVTVLYLCASDPANGHTYIPIYLYRLAYVPAQVQTRGGNLTTWRDDT